MMSEKQNEKMPAWYKWLLFGSIGGVAAVSLITFGLFHFYMA